MLAQIPYHWIDPIILPLFDFLAIRWYGLTYLVGFFLAALILRRLSRSGHLPLNPEQVMDLLGWLVVGVIAGGRLGYIAFYDPEILAEPLSIFAVWQGGLSFHGGLLGVLIAAWIFTRRRGVSFLRVGDGLALAVTPGIFLVRTANFINGELFGRVAGAGVPWAMRFPKDPVVKGLLRAEGVKFPEPFSQTAYERILFEAHEAGVWDRIAARVPLRHPSQVYEALTEGLLLGLVLLLIHTRDRRRGFKLPWGGTGAIFLGGYGVCRFFVEFFRQPDAQFGDARDLGLFTRGQSLCLGMVAGAVVVYLLCARRSREE